MDGDTLGNSAFVVVREGICRFAILGFGHFLAALAIGFDKMIYLDIIDVYRYHKLHGFICVLRVFC